MSALERAIADACLGADPVPESEQDWRAFLRARGVNPADVTAILAAPARLGLYRSLVRNRLSGVVAKLLPRTRARLNAACSGRFDADFSAFLDEAGPRGHYLRDVPAELVGWAAPRWREDARVPPYLLSLAAHELALHDVSACEGSRGGARVGEVALDRPLVWTESARLLAYPWAVHELSADVDDLREPTRRPTRILAYRDQEHAVRCLELTALAFALLSRLRAGAGLASAVEESCRELATLPVDVASDVARLLADLGERGVVLGGG